jgi:Bacterial Ig domain
LIQINAAPWERDALTVEKAAGALSMRVSKAIALAIVLTASSLVSVSSVQAASECPIAGTLSTWGVNSAGVFNIAPGGTCLFPLRIEGVIASSSIVQKPAFGVLVQVNESTFEYTANPGYQGTDTFSVQATGRGPTATGTSVITLVATVR